MAEVKESAARRLKLQMAAENKSQAAVQPAPAQAQQPGQGEEQQGDQKSPEGVDGSFEHPEVAPKPKQKWIATPLSRGRTLYAHPKTLKQRGLQLSSRYAELDDADGNDDEEESKTEDKPPAQPVIEISSDDGLNMPVKPTITTEAKEALHLVKAKPPKLPETPQLVALKQRERDVIAAAAATFADKRGPGLQVSAAPVDGIKSFPEIEELLGIRSVVTPSSGNCMAMALAQAVADHNLAAFDDELEEMTAAIKRGIRWSGQLNYREQFDHFTRMTTLINVERGWDGMTAQDSNKQFKWYLEEYAATPSDRNAIVAGHNWGSSELMAAAANLLQTKIYVLAHNTDKKGLWYCSVYRPSTVTRGRKRYDTGQQVPLHLERCVEEIRAAKTKGNTPPLVLRFWGEHYSAFVHTNPPEVRRVHLPEEETKRAVSAEDLPPDMQAKDGRVALAETPEGSQSPWEPATWDGNIAELRSRLMGMSIPHDLKCEIHLILERADPTRYAELLVFLVNTASQLSLGEREQLLRMNLEADKDDDVRIMMQRYQISKVVLGQWQQTIRREQHKEAERRSNEEEEASPDSDPSYCPPSASSLQTLQEDTVSTTRQLRSQGVQQKRQHTITPIEGEEIRRYMRSKTAHQPDATAVEPMQDDWHASVPTEQKLTRAEWKQLWINQRSVWPATARVPFPQPSRTADEWIETARAEPTNLLLAVQRFPFPDEVLAQLNDQIMEAWTAAWRRDCLHGSLVTYSSRVTDKQTLKWLNKWKEKFIRPPPHNLSPLIDSSEDWNKLRGRQYGEDEVLELCDTGNKRVLAQHLLCALIYDKEIRALTNQEEMSENGALTRLNRHLLALTTVEGYSVAYLTTSNSVDWFAIARYFSTVLEHGPPERDSNY
ncbi:hypothetical protein PF003_g616 [Phytophthora fragariae]|nr:hypothetical protein PF003_g616 [Phytophthora fragariae]